jgi:Zn-finger protein
MVQRYTLVYCPYLYYTAHKNSGNVKNRNGSEANSTGKCQRPYLKGTDVKIIPKTEANNKQSSQPSSRSEPETCAILKINHFIIFHKIKERN